MSFAANGPLKCSVLRGVLLVVLVCWIFFMLHVVQVVASINPIIRYMIGTLVFIAHLKAIEAGAARQLQRLC